MVPFAGGGPGGRPGQGVVVTGGLIFPATLQTELVRLAREGAPEEVCGILAGRGNRVEQVLPIRNVADEVAAEQGVFRDRATGETTSGQKPVHYYMDPRDQLRVYRAVDDAGLDVVGYYHSHTHTEARPSPTDVRLAADSSCFWVLVSLKEDEPHPPVRAWRIIKAEPTDETGEVREETISAG